jgi:hypothetical protein
VTWRLLRKSHPITEDWTAGLDVRLSAAVPTPVTFGTTILLPAECLDWGPTKRRAVLAHERSHVLRGDFYVLLLATLHPRAVVDAGSEIRAYFPGSASLGSQTVTVSQ